MPRFLATQVEAEAKVAQQRFGELDGVGAVDLDAIIKRLLEVPHPTPVLR